MTFECPHCHEPHETGTRKCPATDRLINSSYQLIGKLIGGRYEVIRLLGEGGMGAVYLAKHTQVGRNFAIKVLHEEYTHFEDMVERFMREARAAGEVGHENIIEVYDIGRDDSGVVYMVMQLLEGRSLYDLVSDGNLDSSKAVSIMLQVLAGLEAAHDNGIVHRDMKPENVFLTSSSANPTLVKILDFGIAKVMEAKETDGLTRPGITMGTPSYMSPEQAQGDVNVDRRTDIYACGVMLFEMLSGRPPFEASSLPRLLLKITNEDPLQLQEIQPSIPTELAAAVHKAMARDPDERFQKASAFAGAIQDYEARDSAITDLSPIQEKDAWILEMAEQAMGEMYDHFAEAFKDDEEAREFFASMAATEREHLKTVTLIEKMLSSTRKPRKPIEIDRPGIQSIFARTQTVMRQEQPSLEEALQVSLDLELGAAEYSFTLAMKQVSEEIYELVTSLGHWDKNHAKSIVDFAFKQGMQVNAKMGPG